MELLGAFPLSPVDGIVCSLPAKKSRALSLICRNAVEPETLSSLLRCCWPLNWLSKLCQQLLNPFHGPLMPFHFSLPAMGARVLDQFFLALATAAEPRGIGWRRHKLGTGQIEFAFAGSILR